MKFKTKTTAFVLLCILVPASIFLIYSMSSPYLMSLSPEVYGPKTSNLLIHIYAGPDAENTALEACEIDINDWPLSDYWIDRFATNPDIRLYNYVSLDDFDLDLNNQRWPTGVTLPREFDPATGTYKHYYGTSEWDDEAAAFRHATAHLTPKSRIEADILNGTGVKKETPVPYPAAAGWTDYPELEAKDLIHHYDTVEAASILDAAGFTQGSTSNPYFDPGTPGSAEYIRTDPRFLGDLQPLVFYLITATEDPFRNAAGDMIASEIRKAGIPVNLIVTTKNTCYQQVMNLYDYHLYIGWHSSTADVPNSLWSLFHSEQYWGGTATGYYDGVGWSANYIGFCHNYTKDQGLAGPQGTEEDYYDYNAALGKYGTTFTEVYEACLDAQEIHAKLVANVPLWSSLGTKAYKTGWEGTVNKAGEGKDNYWSFLNMIKTGDDRIDWGFRTNIEGLNIITAEWTWDRKALRQVYDSLIGRNPYNLAEEFGWLAENWESGSWATGKGYVLFTLRQDNPTVGTRAPVFHNGDPVRPLDAAFSLIFTRDCGPGVAYAYSDVKDINKVEVAGEVPTWLVGSGIEQNVALGAREVKVYFDVESYWTIHWAGFIPVLNERIWKDANDANGWGFNTPTWDPMLLRAYGPWDEDSDGDGTVDLEEDGTGAWIFAGYAPPGPISAATSIAFNANTNFYLSQDYIDNYLTYAFHNAGDINEDGIVNNTDYEILERALGTDMWNYPWGTGWNEYNPDADINTCSWDMVNGIPSYGDGYIDYRDLGVWAGNAGRAADGGPSPYPPTADFTPLTCETFYVCESVPFDATASLPGFDGDDECPIVEYRWNFGDTTTETTTVPTTTHHYTVPGDYNVTLTVYAPGIEPYIDAGYVEYDSEVHTIHIIPAPYPPTADFWPPTCEAFYVSELVLFDASASTPGWDGDDICPIVEYRWDFGDATSLATTVPLTTHHYTTTGDYDVNLTVYAPGIGPFIDPDYDPYDSEVHTIHIVSKLEPRKLIDIVEFPGMIILEDIPVDETLLAKFTAMEGFNETKDLLTAKGYNFAETAANASRVTGGLDENTFSGVVLSWWSDVGPKGTRALIAAALMDDSTTMVFGAITNLLPPELTPEGKYIIVDAMPYVYVEWYWWAWSPLGKIVRWSYWWYDSHSHPNWYWGCYWWWRIYIKNYLPPTGLPHWLPWWWWFWHWTYWKHWYWWSTYFPYIDP